MGMLGLPVRLRKELSACQMLLELNGSNEVRVDVPQDARWNISTTPDSDHEVRFEVTEDLIRVRLAHLVHLYIANTTLVRVLFVQCVTFHKASVSAPRTEGTYLIVGDIDLLDHLDGL